MMTTICYQCAHHRVERIGVINPWTLDVCAAHERTEPWLDYVSGETYTRKFANPVCHKINTNGECKDFVAKLDKAE